MQYFMKIGYQDALENMSLLESLGICKKTSKGRVQIVPLNIALEFIGGRGD